MLLGMYLMARLTRIWRALLKVVTTLLLATRDSFTMTMSVIACAADCLNHIKYHQECVRCYYDIVELVVAAQHLIPGL